MISSLNTLGATQIVAGIVSGNFSSVAVAEACLARIHAREDMVSAWEFLDDGLVLDQARLVDLGTVKGPLAGVPVGIKDIIDTRDMPTGVGSSIYDGNRPLTDASCVARLRGAGAVIMGKTVTCEFAGLKPGKTKNPHDPLRTPGGSSSGSCAAVADNMIPLALGTQTGGSVLRPSSYCGIVGFKPSFDTFSLNGVYPAAESLDTLGLHARSISDLELATSVLLGKPFTPLPPLRKPPAVGVCRTWMWDEAGAETREAVETAATAMKSKGAMVRDFELPEEFQWLAEVRGIINGYERAAVMAEHWANNRTKLSGQLQETIQSGLDTSYEDYVDAMYLMETCRVRMNQTFQGCDVLLTPAVDGEAPVGIGDTGSPRFQALWTMLHVPTISLPTHAGPNGLPVGIQLVMPYRSDQALQAVSRWTLDAIGK